MVKAFEKVNNVKVPYVIGPDVKATLLLATLTPRRQKKFSDGVQQRTSKTCAAMLGDGSPVIPRDITNN